MGRYDSCSWPHLGGYKALMVIDDEASHLYEPYIWLMIVEHSQSNGIDEPSNGIDDDWRWSESYM